MAAASKPLDNLDVISHILSDLDEENDGFVATITASIKAEKNVSLSDSIHSSCPMRLGWNPENLVMVCQLTW
jgi:hypothetical protein